MVCESLLIMCLDFGIRQDESMLSDHGYSISKLGVMKSIVIDQLTKYRDAAWRIDGSSGTLYVIIIGFTQEAKIIGMSKALEISKNRLSLDTWFETSVRELRDKRGMLSNITSASKLARTIYDKALIGDMSEFKFNKFESFCPHIVITEPKSHNGYIGESQSIYQVPNTRVVFFSSGMQSNVFEFINYFENAKLCDLPCSGFNGVLTIHLNSSRPEILTGYDTMYELAGICPVHGKKGIIELNNADDVGKLYKVPLMFAQHFGVLCEDCMQHESSTKRN